MNVKDKGTGHEVYRNSRNIIWQIKEWNTGAFGTYYAKKYDTGSLPELANLQASDRVLAIHKEYIEAGAKIIRTNTFASNTVCLGAGFDEVRNNIKNAVDIAREAVKGTDVLVAADIGPIPGENMIEKEHIEKEYVDIVNVFKECGVDIFVFETFPKSWTQI